MRPDAVDHYVTLLADDGSLPSEAFCLTVVRGLSVTEALTRVDAPPSGRTATLADAGQTSVAAYPDDLPLVVADHLDGWTLLAADNGYHCARAEVVAKLSVGTVAASVYWNVEFDSNLMLAQEGRVLSAFEFIGSAPRSGDRPDAIRPYLEGLTFEDAHAYRFCAEALAFLERLSGVRVPADWSTRDLPAAVIVDPLRFRPPNPRNWLSVDGTDLEPSHEAARRAAERACEAHGVVPDGDLLARAHAEYREALHLRWQRCLPQALPADPVERLQAESRRRHAENGAERAAVARAHAVAATDGSRVADPAEALGWAVYNAIQADRAVNPHQVDLRWVQRLT
ncbi:hypothetical protein B0I31_11891 [Saccharothrix carnea]|uniref:Uncharacterized protein n=2 Tax=Saccharothrix carnea TaxID=1280637 RepID=A0A2P8HZX9_SACCR|nr:hypothetical protein B0I31_11891 [Saccharothrix carnea]